MRIRSNGVWPLVVLLIGTACGRSHEVWSGTRLSDDGKALIVAAQVGLCGAMTLENVAGAPVTLRATRGDAVIGRTALAPNTNINLRFDWAGDLDSDVYFVEAVDATGEVVPFNNAVKLLHRSRWTDCSHNRNDYAPLYMNSAMGVFAPGEGPQIPKPLPEPTDTVGTVGTAGTPDTTGSSHP